MKRDDNKAISILIQDLKDSLGKDGDNYEFAVSFLLSRLESWGDLIYDTNVRDMYQELQYYKHKESGR